MMPVPNHPGSHTTSTSLFLMKTSKNTRQSEADDYRRKARDAERAAETTESAEAKEFYLEMAKHYYEMADRAEKNR
jgi:hypothetical protein